MRATLRPRPRRCRNLPSHPIWTVSVTGSPSWRARIDAATYELLCYLHQFNQQYGWEGFRSCAHWLNWRTGLDLGAAREKLRVAAALAELPHIAAAMACGRLSYSKVRALSRVAAPATESRLLALRRHRRAGG